MPAYEIKYTIVESPTKNREIVALEPLERGFGHTLGNALRRVMLGHLMGASITKVKIDGVNHEFTALPGVHEDVVQLIQNLKQVHFLMTQVKTTIVTLDASGESDVNASDLKCPTGLEVLNKDLHIATLSDKKSHLKIELTVEYGQGYRLPVENEKKPIGVILVDANFSPVILSSFTVENTRVGHNTDLDRLIMDITTNGSITPKEAIQQASVILRDHFELLAGDTKVYSAPKEEITVTAPKAEKGTYLEELGFPTRVLNTLKKAGYETAEEVKAAGEEGLAHVKNIGPKTVKMVLKKIDNATE